VSAEVELWMLEGSEFQTVGAAMLKLRETKVMRTLVLMDLLSSGLVVN